MGTTPSVRTPVFSADPSWDPGRGEPVVVQVTVTAKGFDPETARFVKGRPAILELTRVEETSCVDSVKFPWSDQVIDLPLRQTVRIVIPDTSKAGSFRYACWMDMVFGTVLIEDGP